MAPAAKVKKFYEAIPVGQLKVDPKLDAQRMFNPNWAKKLGTMWDPEVLLPAIVSRRLDGDYLLDGQHSTHVAKEKEGEDFLRDCMVFEGLDSMREAKLFLSANRDRKPVKPYDTYRVELTADDPIAKRIETEVTGLGLHVSSGTSKDGIAAVQALKAIADGGPGLVETTLTAADRAWGRDATTWDGMMLRAIAMVINRNGEKVQIGNLSRVLGKKAVGLWKDQAVKGTGSVGGSSSRSIPLAANIVTQYNGLFAEKTGVMLLPPRSLKG